MAENSKQDTNAEDLVWDDSDLANVVPAAIHAVTDSFNGRDYEDIMNPLRKARTRHSATGIEFVLLRQAGDSSESAILHFNPFANGLTDNMLLRAEYLNEAFHVSGVTDSSGLNLPLLTMAAPSGNKRINLRRHHRQHIAKGRFDTLALHYLELVKDLGFKEVAIVAFSQGASLAVAAAAVAHKLDISVTHLAIGEPANVVKRRRHSLVRQFAGSAKHLADAVKATDMHSLTKAHAAEKPTGYMLNILRQIRLNLNLLSGLSKAGFESELTAVLGQNIPVTLSYGGLTTISPPDDMRRIVQQARHLPGYKTHMLHVVEVSGGHHTWADTLSLCAAFYAYGLTR